MRTSFDYSDRLSDIGGGFVEVEITDRYYWDHRPFYTFENPQIQGMYLRYPERAFDLRDEFSEYKEPDKCITFEIKGHYGIVQESLKAMEFRGLWNGFRDFLRRYGISRKHDPEIIALPINST